MPCLITTAYHAVDTSIIVASHSEQPLVHLEALPLVAEGSNTVVRRLNPDETGGWESKTSVS
jgi:hypothetical protein